MVIIMSPSPNNSNRVIEVRKARPQDYEAVLNINTNVYQGRDYLPTKYHDVVNDPDFCYYVCLVDGEMAAFEGICRLDDNRTLMLRSLRVKAKFQGQGLTTPMRTRIYEDFSDLPGKVRFRLGCSEESRFVRSKTFLSNNTLLKMERRVSFHDVDVRQIDLVSTSNVNEAKTISWEDFSHLIQIEQVKNYLYPENIMTQDYWFYETIPSNIRHLKKLCQRVLITKGLYRFLLPSDKIYESFYTYGGNAIMRNIYDPIKGLLGIVSSYFSPAYLCVHVNISGDPIKGNEVEEAESILRLTLECVKSLYENDDSEKRKLLFAVVCPQRLPEGLFYEAAKPFGLEPTRLEENDKHQYYFEQNVNSSCC